MASYPAVNVVDANGNIIGGTGSGTVATSVTVSGNVPVNAPAATTIYSEAAASRLTNGNTTANTWPANVNQCFVGVNVTGFAGGTNVVVSLQQQDGNGNYVTIASTAQITATGTYQLSVGQGLTNGVMLAGGFGYRFAWTVTGTFTTLTFQIGAQAR